MWAVDHTTDLRVVLRQDHGNQLQMLLLLGCVECYRAAAIRLCLPVAYPEEYLDFCLSSTLIVHHDLLLVRLSVTMVLLHLL
jgi:hypothetical protein